MSRQARAQILHLLCEGQSIRAITRLTGVSKNTVAKLLVSAGHACAAYQDKTLRNLSCKRVQMDEIWSFVQPSRQCTLAGDVSMLTADQSRIEIVSDCTDPEATS